VHGAIVERGTVTQEETVRVRLEDVDDRHGHEVAEVEVIRDAAAHRRIEGELVHPPVVQNRG
jgi:hypothetical protein